MAGYTKSWTSVDGDLILANLFNNEYTSLDTAFALASGHKHDGTANEGGYVPMIADNVDLNEVLANVATNTIDFAVNVGSVKTTQLSIADGAILPTTTNDIDLGGVGAEFKDVHSEGTAFLTLIESSGLANLNGGIEVDNGAVVFTVDSATGNVAVNGTLNIQASIAVDSVLDDGTMAANSSTGLVTQASVVTYVSTEITNATLDGGSF